MNWLELILQALKLLAAGMDTAKAYAPTEKMKEERQQIAIPRLTADQYRKELRRITSILVLHPRQSVDAIVSLCCDGYDQDDINDFKQALYQRFPKRKHIKVES